MLKAGDLAHREDRRVRGSKLGKPDEIGGYIMYGKEPSLKCKRLSGSDQHFSPVSIYLSLLSRSISDHHLRCGGWLNLEFSKREKHSGWAIKTIYKK